MKHQLIGAPVSLYTGKLRCYLQYKGIPFEEVLASGDVYRDVIVPRTGVQYIPILITDDDQALQDTTEIMDFLEARYPEAPVYPHTPCQNLVSLLLEIYGDEWLVLPAMHYRWSFDENREFAMAEFGRTNSPNATPEEQYLIGKKASGPFAGALPRLGITETSIPAIEKSYLALLSELDAHFKQHEFLLGSKPCMGDFGLIGPLFAHLYRDPYSGRLMEDVAPYVVAWVKRMIDPKPKIGVYLEKDRVPETLMPVLARMFNEFGPVIASTMNQVADWVQQQQPAHQKKEGNRALEVPRAIGAHGFTVEGVTEQRLIFPYNQWMWQRAVDYYVSLSEEGRVAVDELLATIPNASDLLQMPIHQRVTRHKNRLVLSTS